MLNFIAVRWLDMLFPTLCSIMTFDLKSILFRSSSGNCWFYIITLLSTCGIIMMILLFSYTVHFQQPDIALSAFLMKMIVIGIISLSTLFAVLISTVRSLSDHLNKTISLAMSVASGDFTQRAAVDIRDEIGLTLQSLNEICDRVGGTIADALAVAEEVVSGAMTQSSATEQIASALTQISAMAKTCTENTMQTDTFMVLIDSHTAHTKALMSNLMTSVEDFSKNSAEIRKIIKSIDQVAFQTNLLALNAAIEAARAGETGNSFAVVADEVRNLAARTSEFSNQTRTLIEETATGIESEMALITEVENSFTTIADETSKAKELVSTLLIMSNEQVSAIGQITESMHQVDGVIQQNAADADKLTRSMSVFKVEGVHHRGSSL